jgi:hypothetical protein
MASLVVPDTFKDRLKEDEERMKYKRKAISTDHISSKCRWQSAIQVGSQCRVFHYCCIINLRTRWKACWQERLTDRAVWGSRNSSVGIVTVRVSNPNKGKRFFCAQKCRYRTWDTPILLVNEFWGLPVAGVMQPAREGDHVHLVPRLQTGTPHLHGLHRQWRI